ncbi:hypothetical protein ACWDRB_55165 [Nonomuraea sp. NPDC003707]
MTVMDTGLAQIITSSVALAQTWPGASDQVMMLIHVLRMAAPSLVEVFQLGLVTMIIPPPERISSEITLKFRSVVMTANAKGQEGESILQPHLRPAAVRRLEITDLVAGGRSGLRLRMVG